MKIYPKGTFVIAIIGLEATGTRGKCGILGMDATISQSCAAFSNHEKIDSRFLFYYFIQFGEKMIFSLAQGTKQQNFYPYLIDLAKIAIPPHKEQQKIVSILNNVDDSIQKTMEQIEKTKKIKTGLMQKLLTKGIDHTKFKKVKIGYSQIKEIPYSWDTKKINDICKIVDGTGFPLEYQQGNSGNIPFFKVSDMNLPENSLDMNRPIHTISKETAKLIKAKICPPNTTIFPKIGATIFTHKRRILTKNSCFDNNIMGLIPTKIDHKFLYYLMLQINLENFSQTTAIPYLDDSIIGNVKIPYCKLPEQQKIASILSNVDSQIESLQSKKSQLQKTKQGLMQKLFTGQIRVPLN